MTIAERLRLEKEKAVNFDSVAFMAMVEEFFKANAYDSFLRIKHNDCYKRYPELCEGNLRKEFCKEYPETSYIGVPSEVIENAIALLKREGFNIYRDGHDYVIALTNYPSITCGVNTYYKVQY